MKKILRFIVALTLLCCPISVYAAELNEGTAGSSAVISAEVPSTHTLTVSADKASVTFGGKTGTTFEVPRLTEFTLQISADSGYQVTKVLLDGRDVTKAYKDGKITLSGIYKAGELTILTEKIPVTESAVLSPKTGDTSQSWLWIVLMAAVAFAFSKQYYIMKKN